MSTAGAEQLGPRRLHFLALAALLSSIACSSGSPPPGLSGANAVDAVDDFEDGDTSVLPIRGRDGNWTVTQGGPVCIPRDPMDLSDQDPLCPPGQMQDPNVGSATVDVGPLPAGQDGISSTALHFASTSDASVGYGPGVILSLEADPMKTYDISCYLGLRFWARVGSSQSTTSVNVLLEDAHTEPNGNICDNSQPGNGCYDRFAVTLPALTQELQPFKILWSEMVQAGFARHDPAPDLAHAFGFELQAPAAVNVDIWLDDVAFIAGPAGVQSGGCSAVPSDTGGG